MEGSGWVTCRINPHPDSAAVPHRCWTWTGKDHSSRCYAEAPYSPRFVAIEICRMPDVGSAPGLAGSRCVTVNPRPSPSAPSHRRTTWELTTRPDWTDGGQEMQNRSPPTAEIRHTPITPMRAKFDQHSQGYNVR